MKIYNPNREERAFLYQEAQDLEPLIRNFGSLSVLVEEMQNKKTKNVRYRVTFMVAPESVGMRVQATDKSLFEATIAAKDEALRQLSAIVNSLPALASNEEQSGKIPPELLH
jgi:hypothetical protein